jgi:nucleotide-binding universal stress UspA family protein
MNGPKSILTYLDDSPASAAAVDLGIAWTKRSGALLVGMAVIDEPTIHGSRPNAPISPSYRGAYDQLLAEAQRNAELCLDRFSRRCIEEQVPSKLLEDVGTPRDQLWREAQRYDLLLVGQHPDLGGLGTREEVLSQLLRKAPCPVVAVPPKCPLGGPIVVAYDGSAEAARALHAFVGVGLSSVGEMHILTVDAESSVKAAKTADLAVEFLRFHGIAAAAIPRVGNDAPDKVILETARGLRAGLVVMGACGQSRISEYLLGSVTRTLIKKSEVPLFLYH